MKSTRLSALSLVLAAVLTGCGGGSSSTVVAAPAAFSVAVIGDMPYGTSPSDTAQFLANPAFINTVNNDSELSMVLHAGDIHSGKEYCTEGYDLSVANQWKAFKFPLVFTPGDNEWTDCHKAKQGGGSFNSVTGAIDYLKDSAGKLLSYAGGDPIANLELVRSIFFSNPGKAFGVSMDLHTQAQEFDTAFPSDNKYVENVWWEKSKVLFVTLNIPGGSNNNNDIWYGAPSMSPAQALEVSSRSAANKRWLDTAFKKAIANGDVGVVIMVQGDMWDIDGSAAGANHLTEYKQFTDSIAANTKAFGKPVLLFNGDSHVYRSDNPLVAGAACVIEPTSGATAVACTANNMPAGSNNPADPYLNQPHNYNVPNFRRVVVHGSTSPLEYLKLKVDPAANAINSTDSFGPFSWKRVKS